MKTNNNIYTDVKRISFIMQENQNEEYKYEGNEPQRAFKCKRRQEICIISISTEIDTNRN